MGRVRC